MSAAVARRIIHKLSITEISAVDTPASRAARATIMKRDDRGDAMLTKSDHEASLDGLAQAYMTEKKVSKAEAYDAVLKTQAGKDLYAKSIVAPPGAPVAKKQPQLSEMQKAAISADVTFEVMAKQRFPTDRTPDAIVKYLATDEGSRAYSEYVAEKSAAAAGIR